MAQRLQKDFGTDTGDMLYAAISSQNYIQNGEIDCRDCKKFSQVKLEEKLSGYDLVGVCDYSGIIIEVRGPPQIINLETY